jgi:hypothetical protein
MRARVCLQPIRCLTEGSVEQPTVAGRLFKASCEAQIASAALLDVHASVPGLTAVQTERARRGHLRSDSDRPHSLYLVLLTAYGVS